MSPSIHSPEIQNEIIGYMLSNVSSQGWTYEALEQAVIQAGFQEIDALRAFDGDVNKALFHFIHMIDRQMNEKLEQLDMTSMRVRDRIATAILVRLELMKPYRMALPKIIRYQATPSRGTQALKTLAGTVSDMWYAAGDQVTDFNYYSKRFLLAGVYTSTLLFWLKDDSADFTETRSFLYRRIDNVMKISLVKEKVKSTLQNLGNFFTK